jgi:nucleoporin p58/p45
LTPLPTTRKITAPPSAPTTNLFGGTSQPPPSGSTFSGFGSSTATSQPQTGSNLLGASGSNLGQSTSPFGGFGGQQTQGSSLFSAQASQPTQSGALFGSASSQATQSGGIFASATSQPAQSGSLFGNLNASISQPALSGGLFGSSTAQSGQTGGLLGASMTSKPAQISTIFGQSAQTSQPAQPPGLLGGLGGNQRLQPTSGLAFGGAPSTSINPSSSAKIDLDHLRPTTKVDQLTEQLQAEILKIDEAILKQIQMCNEVADLLPLIAAAGANLPADVSYVSEKLEEIGLGLENDAEEIVKFRDETVKKDAAEARVCFRNVDRLKMPPQYQNQATPGVAGSVYGGGGLSGWWNHPQTLRRSARGADGAGGTRSLHLPGDEDEDDTDRPANILDLFDKRTETMKESLQSNQELLSEVEQFVEGVELKIIQKERELIDKKTGAGQPEDQVKMLKYVFGTVERSLYDVADKIGGARDGVQDVIMGSADRRIGHHF